MLKWYRVIRLFGLESGMTWSMQKQHDEGGGGSLQETMTKCLKKKKAFKLFENSNKRALYTVNMHQTIYSHSHLFSMHKCAPFTEFFYIYISAFQEDEKNMRKYAMENGKKVSARTQLNLWYLSLCASVDYNINAIIIVYFQKLFLCVRKINSFIAFLFMITADDVYCGRGSAMKLKTCTKKIQLHEHSSAVSAGRTWWQQQFQQNNAQSFFLCTRWHSSAGCQQCGSQPVFDFFLYSLHSRLPIIFDVQFHNMNAFASFNYTSLIILHALGTLNDMIFFLNRFRLLSPDHPAPRTRGK